MGEVNSSSGLKYENIINSSAITEEQTSLNEKSITPHYASNLARSAKILNEKIPNTEFLDLNKELIRSR